MSLTNGISLNPEEILDSNTSSEGKIIQWLTISLALTNSQRGLWIVNSHILNQNTVSLRGSD